MRSAEEGDFKPGDLVLVKGVRGVPRAGMPPYPAVVVAPVEGTARPPLMTSIAVASSIGHAYYWVETDRLELVQRGGQ